MILDDKALVSYGKTNMWSGRRVYRNFKHLERATGLEPAVFSLGRRRFTTKPRPHTHGLYNKSNKKGPYEID